MMRIGQALEKTNRNSTQGDSKSHERIQGQAQEDTRTGKRRHNKDRHKRTKGQAQEKTSQLQENTTAELKDTRKDTRRQGYWHKRTQDHLQEDTRRGTRGYKVRHKTQNLKTQGKTQ
jgi:hypothetical protein